MTDEQKAAREALIIAAIAFNGLLQKASELGAMEFSPGSLNALSYTLGEIAKTDGITIMDDPLTRHQMAVMAEANDGVVEGIVRVDLSDVIDAGNQDPLEAFLDTISELLTGGELLSEIEYNVVGHEGDCLWIKVNGNADMIFHGGEYFPWNLHNEDEVTINDHGKSRKVRVGDVEYCSDTLIRLRPDTDGTFLELTPEDIT